MTDMELIEKFIKFLEDDMASHREHEPSKRMDMHTWMIGYLEIRLLGYKQANQK